MSERARIAGLFGVASLSVALVVAAGCRTARPAMAADELKRQAIAKYVLREYRQAHPKLPDGGDPLEACEYLPSEYTADADGCVDGTIRIVVRIGSDCIQRFRKDNEDIVRFGGGGGRYVLDCETGAVRSFVPFE